MIILYEIKLCLAGVILIMLSAICDSIRANINGLLLCLFKCDILKEISHRMFLKTQS